MGIRACYSAPSALRHLTAFTWADGPGFHIFAPLALRSNVLTQSRSVGVRPYTVMRNTLTRRYRVMVLTLPPAVAGGVHLFSKINRISSTHPLPRGGTNVVPSMQSDF